MAADTQKTPNLYQVDGHNLHITYSTSSIDGKPRFVYHDALQTQSFEGDQIRVLESEVGTLVSVTIRRTVDTGSTSFTLLVPHVNLDQSDSAHISTEGITTLHRFSVVPAFNQGQTEVYTVQRLTGTASLVAF